MSKSSPPSPDDHNARMAMNMIRGEIKRILDSWDPLYLKGLRGFGTEYTEITGPLAVLCKKRAKPIDIAAHLDRIVQGEWKLPPCREKCLEIAEKIYRAGAFLDPPGTGKSR